MFFSQKMTYILNPRYKKILVKREKGREVESSESESSHLRLMNSLQTLLCNALPNLALQGLEERVDIGKEKWV